jgi:hypothetical protein
MKKPLCFVLMPFGQKPGPAGLTIDFDAIYRELIGPAIGAAELEPIRADEEQGGGIIHKPMYERLILCEYAVADLSTANANVFYELGLRHAVRPASTVLMFAERGGQLPFDVGPLRALPYALGPDGRPSRLAADLAALSERLKAARAQTTDSPVFQLVEGFPDIQRLKTDVFRERVEYAAKAKQQLAEARREGVDAVRAAAARFGNLNDIEAGVVIDLFLSYRAVKAWTDMIDLAAQMSRPLAETVLVQEQLGLALNRAGKGEEAERLLLALIERRGPSSETYGILGRVYKDRWENARNDGQDALARGFLKKAIDAYLKGFETDWRDAYPGINAVTLMELRDPPDPRRKKLLPVVAYAVERRIAAGKPDYWDHATRLELAILAQDEEAAANALDDALAAVRETWEPETTARNLRLIRETRTRRGDQPDWAAAIEEALEQRSK